MSKKDIKKQTKEVDSEKIIKEIKEDMYSYIGLREDTYTDDGHNVTDIQKARINEIELKYKKIFKDHRGIDINYYGIDNTDYESTLFEDILNILIKFKESERERDQT